MNVRVSLVASLVSAVLLAACSSDDDAPSGSGIDSSDSSRKLKTLESGDAFVTALRAGLIAQASESYYYPESEEDNLPVESPVSPPDASGAPADTDSSTDAGSGESTSDSGDEVTSTNVQEQGVDEKDWVKLSGDGSRLYVLNSAYPYYGGPSVGVPEPVVDLDIGGDELPSGTSMPAPEAIDTTLRIMQLDKEAPDASSLRDLPVPLDGRYAEGFYLVRNCRKIAGRADLDRQQLLGLLV